MNDLELISTKHLIDELLSRASFCGVVVGLVEETHKIAKMSSDDCATVFLGKSASLGDAQSAISLVRLVLQHFDGGDMEHRDALPEDQ